MFFSQGDYTLPLFVVFSFLLMFGGQYLLLRTVRLAFLRHLPWVWVVGILGLAIAALFGDAGGFIDLRNLFCTVLWVYAIICAMGIALAHWVYKQKTK